MGKFMIWTLILAVFVVIFTGCATTTRTTYGTVYGFGTGVAKDAQDTTNAIIRADQWFRENWW